MKFHHFLWKKWVPRNFELLGEYEGAFFFMRSITCWVCLKWHMMAYYQCRRFASNLLINQKSKAPSQIRIYCGDSSKSEISFKMRKINIFRCDFGRRFFSQIALHVFGDDFWSIVLIHRMFLVQKMVEIWSIGKSAFIFSKKIEKYFVNCEKSVFFKY